MNKLFSIILINTLAFCTSIIAQPASNETINMVTDCSHDYSFNLSNASRTQNDIFRGINCLTSGRTIHKMNLEKINAVVVLIDGKLPYLPEDAPFLMKYVKDGGGLYLGIKTGGMYKDSIETFLDGLGLKDGGPRLSKNPKNRGISAHAPSELVYKLGGRYDRFKSKVGPWADYGGSVSYEVYGDGRKLYKGKVLRNGERGQINISVKGIWELKLVATDGGNGKSADGSIWFDPRLYTPDGKSERVLLKNAKSVKVGWARATQDQHFNGNPLGIERQADLKKINLGIAPTNHPAALASAKLNKPGNLPNIQPINENAWQPIYMLGQDVPVILTRKYGKGIIVADTTGLYGAAIEKKDSAIPAMRKIIEYMSSGKAVQPVKGGGGWQFSEGYRWELIKTTSDGLRIHHNEYSKMYVPSDLRAYKESVNYLKQITGLDEKQKAAQITELNERKAKYQRGAEIDIDISNVQELTLLTTDGGNGIGSDHSIWADSFFIDAAGKKTMMRLKQATQVKPGYGRAIEDSMGNDKPLSIGGRKFDNGIFIHANGKLVFPVKGNFKRFTSWAGCSDTSAGSVSFKILGDGKVLWDDGVVYKSGFPGGNPKDVNYIPDGILFQIKYLACVGSGFLLPQGSAVDLPPALKDDWQVHLGMLAHEMGHAWSYPFGEQMGEEASAFIYNNLILHRHYGQKHNDSVTKRLTGYLRDQELDTYDLAKKGQNQKYYMFLDLMIREHGEDIWRNYNMLKYSILNKEGAEWNPHAAAWLWSIAAGRDVFPDLQTAFGTSVSKDKVKLPEQVMQAGFDPVAVGRLYNMPLVELPRKRVIFESLKNFRDVREFYKKETKEKGHPKHEG